MRNFLIRVGSKSRRTLAKYLYRRKLLIDSNVPLISFTFDDAPISAFEKGREILEQSGARATYYVSFGMLGCRTEIGRIGGLDDVRVAEKAGHEIGCHTFDHVDAWEVSSEEYLDSVDANQSALATRIPGARFRTFAYPKNGAIWVVKKPLAERFDCCRGGGQTLNAGIVDRNLLSACFLDERARVDLDLVRNLIDENARVRGWLIFVAHDIRDGSPAPFSCGTQFFSDVVRAAADSGAALIPVGEALDRLMHRPVSEN